MVKVQDTPRKKDRVKLNIGLLTYLLSIITEAGARAAGCGGAGKQKLRNLINYLKTHQTLDNASPKRQPVVYTQEVCEQMDAVLAEASNNGRQLNTKGLLQELQRRKTLSRKGHSAHHARRAYAAHVQKTGRRLITRCRATIPILNSEKKTKRTNWCSRMLHSFGDKTRSLKQCVFWDVTGEQQSQHPKASTFLNTSSYLSVPGTTEAAARGHYSRDAEPGNSGTLKAGVFVQLGMPNFVYTLACSKVPGITTQNPYKGSKGAPSKGLTAEEFKDVLKQYLEFRKGKAKGDLTKERRFTLIVDGDRPHISKTVQEFATNHQIDYVVLPPNSHDLSPLDSHFFAVAKNHSRAQVRESGDLSWGNRANTLLKNLQETDADPHIINYALKMEACKDVHGDWLEERYEQLKRERNL